MKNQHNHQKQYFGESYSKINDYYLSPWMKTYVDRIKADMLNDNYKGKVLIDIATGTGYVAVEMARLGMNVIACDLTPESIKNLNTYKKKYKLNNLKIFLSKAEEITLETNSVDYIVANAILEHIPQEAKAIKEWKRIMRNNGKIYITVPLQFRYIWPFFWPINIIHDKKIGHLRRYNKEIVERKFNMVATNVYYTGHMVKVLGVLLGFIVKNTSWDNFIEKIDGIFIDRRYGASNISLILKNKNSK